MKIKSKKSYWDKFPDNVYRRNLDTMKLLVSWDKFQSDTERIRSKSDIPMGGLKTGQEIEKWWDRLGEKSDKFFAATDDYLAKRKRLLYLKKRRYRDFLKEQENINAEVPVNKFHKGIDEIIKKYRLPYNFRGFIEKYILSNKISAPSTNFVFSFSFHPGRTLELETGKNWKEQIKGISLITYARLTEKEIRFAVKELRSHQKYYLPPTVTQDVRVHIDIDKAIEIEQKMKKREWKLKKRYIGYLAELEKASQKSEYYKKEFEKWKKKRPNEIEKEIKKYTSKEIAKEYFGTEEKAPLVRQIYSRVKKEREKRFGKIV